MTHSYLKNPATYVSRRRRFWSSVVCQTRRRAALWSCGIRERAMSALTGRSRLRPLKTILLWSNNCKDHWTLDREWPRRCRIHLTRVPRSTMMVLWETICSSPTITFIKWSRLCCQRQWWTRRRKTSASLNCGPWMKSHEKVGSRLCKLEHGWVNDGIRRRSQQFN